MKYIDYQICNILAWLYPYYAENGEFKFKQFLAHEILPFWKDREHTELDFALRINTVIQNKKLPGVFMNFVSVARATASLADRGYAALPLELDWGVDGKVMTVTSEDLQKNLRKIFGYDYTHEKLKGLRDLFKNIHTAYIYKLMKNGAAATNTFGNAICKGVRGNDLKLVISANVDDVTKFDISIYLGSSLVDEQLAVGPKTDVLADNDFVKWKKGVALEASAGTLFTAGSNGESVEGAEHQEALAELDIFI